MWLKKASRLIEREAHRLSIVLLGTGAVVLAVMMFLTGADVFLRYLFNRPITGSYELTEFMMLLVVFFGLAYTQVKRGHVSVDLVVRRLSERAQAVTNSIAFLVSLGIFSLISWQIVLLAKDKCAKGHVSRVLGVPYCPFLFMAAFAATVLCLVFLIDFIGSLTKGREK